MTLEIAGNVLEKVKSEKILLTWLLAFSIYCLFVLPGTVLTLYQNELNFTHLELLKYSLPFIGILTAFLFFTLRQLPRNGQEIIGFALLLFIFFALYNTYFNDYGDKVIDKDADVFNSTYHALDYLILLSFTALFLVFRRGLQKHLVLIFCILLFSGLGNLVFLEPTKSSTVEESSEKQLLSPSFHSFSANQNIIHIVLDAFQGSVFSEILANDPEMASSFTGFTFFPDALTSSPNSYLSFASFLSGRAYQGTEPISEYQRRTGMGQLSEDGATLIPPVLNALKKQGFDLDILANTGSHMRRNPVYRSYQFYPNLSERSKESQLGKIADLTLIRILPWKGKRYIYRDGSWLFSADHENLPRSNRAEKFLKDIAEEIDIDNAKPTYKLIHLISPHQPWTTSHDCQPQDASNTNTARLEQAHCIIRATAFLLDKLNKFSIYNNSLIIVQGDHGNCYSKNLPEPGSGRPECIGNANPLVLIKPPGIQDPLSTNEKFVELTDLPATIFNLLGTTYEGPGQSMMSGGLSEDTERTYYLFRPNSFQAYLLDRYTSVSRYSVKGSIFDGASWREEIIDNPYQNIESIPKGNVIGLDKLGITEDGKLFWAVWQGNPAKKYMYIEIGGKKTPISIHGNHFRFPAPDELDYTEVYIVDPLRNIKQEMVLPKN